ncbi:hypothetical protein MWU49_06510 [Alcanivorax sp. S6407]|uniref:hypothetical protein n=1 Tax=Alcanivorax sp. S6407 TaxID=2926424 RepID=UPI001FF6F034|nr:hypothetical protein [Alcanivorax sp. S6407]MCK0153345.1 hypothetical protein [Alcanivorax sp. S6407]
MPLQTWKEGKKSVGACLQAIFHQQKQIRLQAGSYGGTERERDISTCPLYHPNITSNIQKGKAEIGYAGFRLAHVA